MNDEIEGLLHSVASFLQRRCTPVIDQYKLAIAWQNAAQVEKLPPYHLVRFQNADDQA